jgi:hypothetical protein
MSPACGNRANDPVATVFGRYRMYVAMRHLSLSPRPRRATRNSGYRLCSLFTPSMPSSTLCSPPSVFHFLCFFCLILFLRRSHGRPAGSMHRTSMPMDHPPVLLGRGAAGTVISPTRSLAARGDSYSRHACSTRIQRLPLVPSSGCLGPKLRPSSDIFEPFGPYRQMQCSEELSIHEWDWGASRPPCACMRLIRSGLPCML